MSAPNRPTPRRSSLAGSSPAAPPQETKTAPAAPQEGTVAGPTQSTTPHKADPSSTSEATARLGVYLTPAQFDNAKAAYLADWTQGGQADTFARWIGQALDTHARRTPTQRGDLTQPKVRADERTGATRSFSVPVDTVARMRAAITADQQNGRWPSDSAWCVEAIGLAVESARAAAGGSLPTPPARLPNRLLR